MAELRLVTKPCACGTARPPYTCGWKLKFDFLIPAGKIVEGDKMQFGLAFMPVIIVKVRKTEVAITTALGTHDVRVNTPALVRRVGRCGAACCDKCAREVGEGRYICRAHWDAWEQREALDQTMEAYIG